MCTMNIYNGSLAISHSMCFTHAEVGGESISLPMTAMDGKGLNCGLQDYVTFLGFLEDFTKITSYTVFTCPTHLFMTHAHQTTYCIY